MKKMNVLYVSTLCSERLITEMLNNNLGTSNLAAQKFHRLIVQGMSLNDDIFNLNVLSVPVFQKNYYNNRFFVFENENERGVTYIYTPVVLIPIIKRFITAFSLFCSIVKWWIKNNKEQNVIVFDILNLGTSIVSLFCSKIFRIKSVAIVTDLPSHMYVFKEKLSLINKLVVKFQNWMLTKADGYVFLTEAMNANCNKKLKPYCIIEGLADFQLLNIRDEYSIQRKEAIFHYSGGLYEIYGVKALIDAFMLIENKDIRLHLFGMGDLVAYIVKCSVIDPRIIFFGYKDNKIVLEDQLAALILVNPRFSHDEYTKYSFPSKTIEYMASGIPLLTTKLPGIPKEYFDFVLLFEQESVEEYKKTLNKILKVSPEELKQFGHKARNFVLENKNNKKQMIKFYNSFYNKLSY
jgi:glycosyltransferase involved in cell wall biosynthesis